MSSLPVHTPDRGRVPRLYVAVGAMLFAAALAASLGGKPSVGVMVDGRSRRVETGTTIGDLAREGYFEGEPGRMVSLSGRVLARSSGVPARAWRNGQLASDDRVVFNGDVIESADGRNMVEPVTIRKQSIPFPRRIVGSGPLLTLSSPGSPGIRQLRVGALSGEVITSTVVVQPSPMIVKRYGARPNQKVVALTFDDGPWPGQTAQILHVLRQYKVKASFFMVGYLVKRYPSIAHEVAAEGHVIGNHTMGHRTLTRLKSVEVDKQIRNGEKVLQASTGQKADWFRPPGGNISPAVWSRVRKAGLKVALWNVDPQDWRGLSSKAIAHDVVIHVRPGSIVLLHDGGGGREQTIRALPVIIRSLQSRGYRFVTLDQMPQR